MNTSLNTTDINSHLTTISDTSKVAITKIKEIVPYEVWMYGAVTLLVIFFFTKGGSFMQSGLFNLGIKLALLGLIILVILTI